MTNSKGSIRRRLALQLAIIAAILSLAFILIVRAVAEKAAAETQDNILLASAISIADTLHSERGAVTLDLPYSALSMLGEISADRVFYNVVIDGESLTGYEDLTIADLPRGLSDSRFSTFSYRGEDVRSVAVARPVSTGEGSVNAVVIVAQTRRGLAAISSRITVTATAVGLVFFLCAVALSLFAAQNALRPLQRMTQSVARRGPKDLRPVETEIPSELVGLVEALNSFMARLRDSLLRSEDFIAEAAHRIRTPLATVRTQAEVAYRRLENPADRKIIREMIRAIDESSRSAGQLLDHAMVTFRTDQMETTQLDLGDLLRDTFDRLSPTADLKDIHLELNIADQPYCIQGDPILLHNTLRNILDNAIKYSPAESVIKGQISEDEDYRISIIDEGRGFGDADISKLTGRFSRGNNVTDVVGSGLGLTIAEDVARAHKGRIEIASNTEGPGACVSLVLPRS